MYFHFIKLLTFPLLASLLHTIAENLLYPWDYKFLGVFYLKSCEILHFWDLLIQLETWKKAHFS